MTEQEVRKIVKEELLVLLTNYQDLSNETDCITDRTGTICYGYRKRHSAEQILAKLIDKLKTEVTN
jgi:hypothetical protein